MSSATTVVIPVWGTHASYLEDGIGTLLSQNRPPERIVVVDNRSDPPLTVPPAADVVRSERRVSVGAARNLGLAATETPYVLFWDVDDVMAPGALARMTEVLDSDPGAVAATMASIAWTPETGPLERWPWPRPAMYRLCRRPAPFLLASMVTNTFNTTGPALLRTEAVKDAGGFAEDIAYLEDWALSMALAARGRVRMLDEVGRLYRLHAASLSSGMLDAAEQRDWHAGLRRHVRRDHATPAWLRAALPLVRLAHIARERRPQRPDVGAGYYERALRASASTD